MAKLPDERSLAILADILEKSENLDGLDAKRYRADHVADLDLLDSLINNGRLLKTGDSLSRLKVGHIALHFLHTEARDRLLADINRVLNDLRAEYKKALDAPVPLASLATRLNMSLSRVQTCIYYLREAFSISGAADLRDPQAEIFPPETLIRFGAFEELLSKQAREWFPDLFKRAKEERPVHGNAEINARKREEVLGAALAAVTIWPDICKRGESFNGFKIAKLIDQKAKLWWKSGEPPLSLDRMTRLINKYLKLGD